MKLKHYSIFLFFLNIFLTSQFCATVPKGFGHVSSNDLKAFRNPSLKSEVVFSIDKTNPYEVLATNIKDLNSTNGTPWLKIRQKDKTGFIQEENKGSKYGIQIFLAPIKERFGIVTATQLLLRDYPGSEGKVLGKLKTRETVEILAEGQNKVNIDGNSGTWAKVKSNDGKIGFVFTPYIMRGEDPNILLAQKDLEMREEGWVYILEAPDKLYDFKNGKLKAQSKYADIRSEEFLPITGRLVRSDGKVYFKVYKANASRPGFEDDVTVTVLAEGYISSNLVKTAKRYPSLYISIHPQDSLKKKIIEKIDQSGGKEVDVESVQVSTFKHKGKTYYVAILRYISGYSSCDGFSCGEYDTVFAFSKVGNNLEEIFANEGDHVYFHEDDLSINIDRISPPEGDETSGVTTQIVYKFNGSRFEKD
ncbi:SH3 domain-containing protein [Leptospira neocaledonica]|uniref:SH3 domain-containing protein n=1 Tax=Leptospira neocaledonica TaxID=2023192 RepID=UPI0013FDEA88|nr:SH3 domain-containing protein [Leptospira neocaledonica]